MRDADPPESPERIVVRPDGLGFDIKRWHFDIHLSACIFGQARGPFVPTKYSVNYNDTKF